jgi:hypothetical protein
VYVGGTEMKRKINASGSILASHKSGTGTLENVDVGQI